MPSSLVLPASVESGPVVGLTRPRLLDLLSTVPDPRRRRGVRHRVDAILAVGIAAVLAGSRSFVAIGEWAADASTETLVGLGVTAGRRPSEATIRRAFQSIDADVLDRVIGAWMWLRTGRVAGRRVIAVDGKTVRGARKRKSGHPAPHLVAALDHDTGTMLGQVQTSAKSNEIPALRDLLDSFPLEGVVVTADAMHTQRDTAEHIIAQGGHYLLTVKKNQPALYRLCTTLPWSTLPGSTEIDTRHGRRTRRTITVVQAPPGLDFPHAVQVAQIRRTRTVHGKKAVETVYLICSLNHVEAPPQASAAWTQGHWGIENRLHWVRDVTYDEDRSQTRTGQAPRDMATIRSTAISLLRLAGHTNIAATLRHHARDPTRPEKLLLTS